MSSPKNMVCYFPLQVSASMIPFPGDIIYLKALGKGILVLGSHRRTVDLLEKRATNYSDRPTLPAIDLCVLFVD